MSLASIFYAAWAFILSKYRSQPIVGFGSVISDRLRLDDVDFKLIGNFLNVLPTVVSCNPDRLVKDWIKEIRDEVLSGIQRPSFDYQRYMKDHSDLLESLFQTVISVENFSERLIDDFPVSFEIEEVTDYYKSYDQILISIAENLGEGSITLEFYNAIIHPFIAENMLVGLKNIVLQIVSNKEGKISDLKLNQAHPTQNKPTFPLSHASIVDPHLFLKKVAAVMPNNCAVVDGEFSWTYLQLEFAVSAMASWLYKKGIRKHDRIGLIAARNCYSIIAFMAIQQLGCWCAPIDALQPTQRLQDILQELRPKIVLDTLNDLSTIKEAIELLYQKPYYDYPDAVACEVAYVIYTSGSTGRPRGVVVSRAALRNTIKEWQKAYFYDDDSLNILQIGNIGSDVFWGDWLKSLYSRGTLHLTNEEQRRDPCWLAHYISEKEISLVESTPVTILALLQKAANHYQSITSLKWIIVGADYFYVTQCQQILALIKDGPRLVNGYGLTEATIETSIFEPKAESSSQIFAPYVPIGRPFEGVYYRIVDQAGYEVPVGVVGNLVIDGIQVSNWYLQEKEMVPIKDCNGFATGDMAGKNPDGFIEFFGRADKQIKLNGFRVELGEIENALQSITSIEQAVVMLFAFPHGQQLVAFITSIDSKIDEASLKNCLRTKLPYYMIPYSIQLVERLPLNGNGKVDRKLLAEMKITNPVPKTTMFHNDTKGKIQKIWSTLLTDVPERDDISFFEFGGTSLLLIGLLQAMREAFYVDVSIGDLFSSPTIGTQTTLVERKCLEQIAL